VAGVQRQRGPDDVSETNDVSRREADPFPLSEPELFDGPGPSRAALRAVDWASTPLGAIAHWPFDLRAGARIVSAAPVPMALWWGAHFYQFHNDALLQALGAAGPALGRPAAQCWPQWWSVFESSAVRVLTTGDTVSLDDVSIPTRDGSGAAHWAVALGPLRDDFGEPAGVVAGVVDLTAHVLERRTADETTANLQIALLSNRRIGTAIGILMAHRRITDTAAFELLRAASQRTHRKLREVAEDVVLTGALPGE
jgi:hypothetical protein